MNEKSGCDGVPLHALDQLRGEAPNGRRRHRRGHLEHHGLEADRADVSLLLRASEHLGAELGHHLLHARLVHLADERREAFDSQRLHLGGLCGSFGHGGTTGGVYEEVRR